MIDRIKLVEMIRRSPGVRTMQLCDQLDEDIERVEIALARELNAGAIEQHNIVAPNGRPAVAFTLTGVPLPRQLPMADKNTSVKGKADNPEAAPQAMPSKALTNVEKAIAFIKEQPDQTATSAQLHMALNLKAADVPSQYLGNALKDGRLVKDGKNWTLGPAARATGNDAPIAQKSVPVAGKPASLAKDTGSVSQNPPLVPEKAASVPERAPSVASAVPVVPADMRLPPAKKEPIGGLVIQLTEVPTYNAQFGEVKIDGLRVVSEWNGLKELRDTKDRILIVAMYPGQLGNLFGGIPRNDPLSASVISGHPDLIASLVELA